MIQQWFLERVNVRREAICWIRCTIIIYHFIPSVYNVMYMVGVPSSSSHATFIPGSISRYLMYLYVNLTFSKWNKHGLVREHYYKPVNGIVVALEIWIVSCVCVCVGFFWKGTAHKYQLKSDRSLYLFRTHSHIHYSQNILQNNRVFCNFLFRL